MKTLKDSKDVLKTYNKEVDWSGSLTTESIEHKSTENDFH